MGPHEPGTEHQMSEGRIEQVFSSSQIAARVETLAEEIVAQSEQPLLVVAILKGSFVFAADLIRALHRAGSAPDVDFMTLSSYRHNVTSSGAVEILRDVELDVAGRNVLLVDDILESGRTLAFAKDLITARSAARVMTCVLLDKGSKRAVDVTADFKAFDCPEVFVVGYGMDVGHRYRELPFVGQIVHD
jgi:hypoxanthine phosphoribosyltransferase